MYRDSYSYWLFVHSKKPSTLVDFKNQMVNLQITPDTLVLDDSDPTADAISYCVDERTGTVEFSDSEHSKMVNFFNTFAMANPDVYIEFSAINEDDHVDETLQIWANGKTIVDRIARTIGIDTAFDDDTIDAVETIIASECDRVTANNLITKIRAAKNNSLTANIRAHYCDTEGQ